MTEQKVILLTGSTAGIGQEAARRLAAAGHTVVCVARSQSKAERLVAELHQRFGELGIAVGGGRESAAETGSENDGDLGHAAVVPRPGGPCQCALRMPPTRVWITARPP